MELKFCKDCKHATLERVFDTHLNRGGDVKTHEYFCIYGHEKKFDLVTGEGFYDHSSGKEIKKCHLERSKTGWCGIEGTRFESLKTSE